VQQLERAEDHDCEASPGVVWRTADRLINMKDPINYIGKRYADAVWRSVNCDCGTDSIISSRWEQEVVYEGVLGKLGQSLQNVQG
jgi:hypothetical protein